MAARWHSVAVSAFQSGGGRWLNSAILRGFHPIPVYIQFSDKVKSFSDFSSNLSDFSGGRKAFDELFGGIFERLLRVNAARACHIDAAEQQTPSSSPDRARFAACQHPSSASSCTFGSASCGVSQSSISKLRTFSARFEDFCSRPPAHCPANMPPFFSFLAHVRCPRLRPCGHKQDFSAL